MNLGRTLQGPIHYALSMDTDLLEETANFLVGPGRGILAADESNGKGEMVNRGNKKILPIKYTPDFVGSNFVIECKGRANQSID